MARSGPAATGVTTGAAAAGSAALLMAQFVTARAVRDGLYLSNLPDSTLPRMMLSASIASVLLALAWPRLSAGIPPVRFLRRALLAAALMFLIEWMVGSRWPRESAVLVYLQVSMLTPLFGSALWLIASERFDPRAARQAFARMIAAGAAGGLGGGLITGSVVNAWGISWALPLTAALSVASALWVTRLDTTGGEAPMSTGAALPGDSPRVSGLRVLARVPFLRHLAVLTLLGAVAAAMLDYLFKSSAGDAHVGGPPLVQFFAWYYGLSAVAVIAVQMLATAAVLERAGVARAVMASPAAVIAGAAGTLLVPGDGMVAITVTRAMESVLRGSLFRSAYEIFFTPVAAADKRAAKSVIDVGFDRLGEAAGAVFVLAVVGMDFGQWQDRVLLIAAIAASAGALLVATWLTKGYIAVLEGRLREQALALSLTEVRDLTTRAVLQRTLITAPGTRVASRPAPAGGVQRAPGRAGTTAWDTDTLQVLAIRSGRPERITRVLQRNRLSPALVPHAIALLDEPRFSTDAATALARVAAEHIGALIDVMLDERRPSTVRRRVARLLGGVPRRRAVDGLLEALNDADFSLRLAAGRSLASIRASNPEVQLDPALFHAAVLRELSLGRAAWDRLRAPAETDEQDARAFADEFVRHRAHEGLAHVFLLLSFVLPSEPLRIAYRGLHTDDRGLRGTVLEYLDSVLPADVRDALWPYIAAEEPRRAPPGPSAEARTRLLASHPKILKNLITP